MTRSRKVQGRVLVGLNRLPATYTLKRLSSLYRDGVERSFDRRQPFGRKLGERRTMHDFP